MFYLEFDEDKLINESSAGGDVKLNAKQLAGMMAADERIAALVAMAIPWYAHLTEGVDSVATVKHTEIVEYDPHNYLIQAAEII